MLRPHQTEDELAEHESSDAYAVAAFEDDRIVSVGFIVREGEPGEWRVRGMATATEHRGRGAGAGILSALTEHARDQGARRIWCTVRTPARSLYERAGFVAVSDEYDIPPIGPHIVFELRLSGE